MNLVVLCGNLTIDPVLARSASGVNYVNFSVAVQRYAADPSQRKADFISCTAFGSTAENICKYFKKGSRIIVRGEWRTDNYTDSNGNKIYSSKMLVSRFYFCEKSSSNTTQAQQLSVPYQQTQNNQIRNDFEVPTMNEVPPEDFGFSTDDDFGF